MNTSLSLRHFQLALLITTLLTLIGGATFLLSWHVLSAASCHLITSPSQTPSGYASPVSFFGGSLLIKGDCNAGSIAVTVGNGEPTTYIYDKSYLWTGSQWQSKTLTGSNKQGAWIPETATVNLTSSQSPTYYVAYTCEWVNQAWKCGCQNQSCTQNQWQLQIFQTASNNQGGGGYTGGNGTQECPLKNDLFLNPFNKDSAFHRPIGTGAQYAGESHPVNRDLQKATSLKISPNLTNGKAQVKVTGSDPVKTVVWDGTANGANLPAQVRIPQGYTPNIPEGHDSVFTFLDVSSKTGHQFYHFFNNNGQYRAGTYHTYSLESLGHGTKAGQRVGSSASGVASGLGLLRYEEVTTAGMPIRHAMQLVLPRTGTGGDSCLQLISKELQLPATLRDGSWQTHNNGAVPYGALFAIPPSVNINSLGLSEKGKRIAEAMQNYGMYLVDGGGCNGALVRGDGELSTDSALRNQLSSDLTKILRQVRFVTNSEWQPNQSTVGGGQPLAPNCAFDA